MKLSEQDLRHLGAWAANVAARVLPLFEAKAPADARPREAIAEIRAFARGGKRTALLRTRALAALKAAREVDDPVATAAGRACGLAAAIAFTHPIATAIHAKHVLGPAAYAALAKELAVAKKPASTTRKVVNDVALATDLHPGDLEIEWAIAAASTFVRTIVRRWPARDSGRGRVAALMFQLDAGLRRRKR